MANEKRLIDANALSALESLDYDYAPVRDGCAWSSEYDKPYCPNCGAKMDLED
jgi:hypothetical protein